MRQLVQRVASLLRGAAGVRGAPGHLQQHRADAGRRQGQAVGRTAALAGEHGVVLRAELGDEVARTGGADLLVAVDQHRDQLVVVEADGAEERQNVQDQRDAALVVRDAEPVRPLVDHAERLLGELSAQIDRVHVGQQQDAALTAAAKPSHYRGADLVRRVDHDVGVVVGDQLHFAAEPLQPSGDDAGDPAQTFRVTAAGLDRHELAQRFQQRLAFRLGRGHHRAVHAGCGALCGGGPRAHDETAGGDQSCVAHAGGNHTARRGAGGKRPAANPGEVPAASIGVR